MKLCKFCNKVIKKQYSESKKYFLEQKKFCDQKCYQNYWKQNIFTKLPQYKKDSRQIFNCDFCNKEFKEYKSNLKGNKNKFCSMKCRGKFTSLLLKKFFGKINEYKNLHKKINKLKGKAKQCILCGSMGGLKGCDWANIDNNYSINPNDYVSLCRKCHRNYDMGNVRLGGASVAYL